MELTEDNGLSLDIIHNEGNPDTTTSTTTDDKTTLPDGSGGDESGKQGGQPAFDQKPDGNDDTTVTELTVEQADEISKKYGGTSIDEDGNVIDDNGKIVKEFKDIDYSDILKGEDNGTIKVLSSILGEISDETGTAKTYENTPEGIKQYVEDSLAIREEVIRTTFENELNPLVKKFNDHINAGKRYEDFLQRKHGLTDIVLDKTKSEELLEVIGENLAQKGLDKIEIDRILKLEKSGSTDDELFERAKKAQGEIKTRTTNLDAENKRISQEREAANLKSIETYWNGIKDVVVNKGTIVGTTIPVKERDKFFDYVSRAVDDNGNSQDDVNMQKMTQEERLYLSYLRFKGVPLSKLIEKSAEQKNVEKIKFKIAQSKKNNNDGNNGNITPSGSFELSLDSIQ
jgi:hypothetical protein